MRNDMLSEDYKAMLRVIVVEFFNSESLADEWFDCSNPLIGGMTPNEMLAARPEKCYHTFLESWNRGLK